MGWEGVQTTSGSESFGRKRKVKFIDKIHQKMGIKRFHLVSGSPVEEEIEDAGKKRTNCQNKVPGKLGRKQMRDTDWRVGISTSEDLKEEIRMGRITVKN